MLASGRRPAAAGYLGKAAQRRHWLLSRDTEAAHGPLARLLCVWPANPNAARCGRTVGVQRQSTGAWHIGVFAALPGPIVPAAPEGAGGQANAVRHNQ